MAIVSIRKDLHSIHEDITGWSNLLDVYQDNNKDLLYSGSDFNHRIHEDIQLLSDMWRPHSVSYNRSAVVLKNVNESQNIVHQFISNLTERLNHANELLGKISITNVVFRSVKSLPIPTEIPNSQPLHEDHFSCAVDEILAVAEEEEASNIFVFPDVKAKKSTDQQDNEVIQISGKCFSNLEDSENFSTKMDLNLAKPTINSEAGVKINQGYGINDISYVTTSSELDDETITRKLSFSSESEHIVDDLIEDFSIAIEMGEKWHQKQKRLNISSDLKLPTIENRNLSFNIDDTSVDDPNSVDAIQNPADTYSIVNETYSELNIQSSTQFESIELKLESSQTVLHSDNFSDFGSCSFPPPPDLMLTSGFLQEEGPEKLLPNPESGSMTSSETSDLALSCDANNSSSYKSYSVIATYKETPGENPLEPDITKRSLIPEDLNGSKENLPLSTEEILLKHSVMEFDLNLEKLNDPDKQILHESSSLEMESEKKPPKHDLEEISLTPEKVCDPGEQMFPVSSIERISEKSFLEKVLVENNNLTSEKVGDKKILLPSFSVEKESEESLSKQDLVDDNLDPERIIDSEEHIFSPSFLEKKFEENSSEQNLVEDNLAKEKLGDTEMRLPSSSINGSEVLTTIDKETNNITFLENRSGVVDLPINKETCISSFAQSTSSDQIQLLHSNIDDKLNWDNNEVSSVNPFKRFYDKEIGADDITDYENSNIAMVQQTEQEFADDSDSNHLSFEEKSSETQIETENVEVLAKDEFALTEVCKRKVISKSDESSRESDVEVSLKNVNNADTTSNQEITATKKILHENEDTGKVKKIDVFTTKEDVSTTTISLLEDVQSLSVKQVNNKPAVPPKSILVNNTKVKFLVTETPVEIEPKIPFGYSPANLGKRSKLLFNQKRSVFEPSSSQNPVIVKELKIKKKSELLLKFKSNTVEQSYKDASVLQELEHIRNQKREKKEKVEIPKECGNSGISSELTQNWDADQSSTEISPISISTLSICIAKPYASKPAKKKVTFSPKNFSSIDPSFPPPPEDLSGPPLVPSLPDPALLEEDYFEEGILHCFVDFSVAVGCGSGNIEIKLQSCYI